jgi:hypothetical protein
MPRRVSLAGLILVIVIWAGVLLTPQLRLLLRAQSEPLPNWMNNKFYATENSLASIVRRHPNDPRVLAAQVEDLSGVDLSENYRKIQMKKYDALIKRFPDELWLIQNRLRLSMLGGLAIDTGDFKKPANRETRWLSRTEILQALKIAELGDRRDPQNSFYDWMRATFLFSLKRNEDAMLALQQGAQKARYDDGVLVDGRIRLEVLAMQSPLLWEERVRETLGLLLPHYARMRNTNLAAIWRGVLAERKGDHKSALKIYDAQMSLCRMMWRDSSVVLGTMVARAMAQEVWDAVATENHIPKQSQHGLSNAEKFSRSAANFSKYATSHGRSDLATAATSDAQMYVAEDDRRRSFFESSNIGVSDSALKPMLFLNWFSSLLIRALALNTLAWLVLSALFQFVPLRFRSAKISGLDIISGIIFVSVPCLVLVLNVWRVSLTPWEFMLPIDTGTWGTSENVFLPVANNSFIWLSSVLILLYCSVGMLWRERGKRISTPRESSEDAARVKRIQGASAFLLVSCGFAFLWWTWSPWESFNNVIAFVGVLLPLPMAWIICRVGKRWLQKQSAENLNYTFARCRSTLGTFIVFGSIVYLICALGVLPLRREADARLDKYLQYGETKMMREYVSPN